MGKDDNIKDLVVVVAMKAKIEGLQLASKIMNTGLSREAICVALRDKTAELENKISSLYSASRIDKLDGGSHE